MQMILNELSSRFPLESPEDGRQIMGFFLDTCFEVKKMIHNDITSVSLIACYFLLLR